MVQFSGSTIHIEEVFRIVNEDTRAPVEQPVRKVLASGVIKGLANHTLLIAKDGTEWPIDDCAAPIKASDGKMVGAILVFRNIAEQRDAERKLKDARSRLDSALEAGAIATWTWDIPNDRVVADRNLAHLFSVSPEDAAGGPIASYVKAIHPEDRERVFTVIERSLQSEERYEAEYRLDQPDGSIRWVVATGKPDYDAERNPLSLSGIVVDITDRKEAEEAKERRGKQLQKLAEIANRVSSARDVNSVLGVVAEEARNLVGAHQSALSMVLNPHYPQPLNVVSNSEKYPHGSISPEMNSLTFYDAIREANEPIRMTRTELDADPRWSRLAKVTSIDPTANGWLAAPLVGRDGRSMGLIQLADKQEGEFNDEDEAIIAQLSRLASIAVQNARLNEELRSNDERKDEFLAMLAHELRNPLAAIGNAVTLGKRTGEKQHIDWSMDVITRQMQHLSRLIDDLMDVSRITRGKIQLRRDIFDLTPILESAASTVGTLVEERKHTLKLDIEPGGLWVNVDPTRIEQVVVNLLNNAAKYSENEGYIRLSAKKANDQVVVSIKDKGVGIAPEKLPEMFELFAQGDRSLARSEGGLGIGLTVVKKLVEMHGGIITASSDGVGKGSEFIVRLPLVAKPPVVRTDAPVKSAAKRKVSILVVDDNVDTVNGMARLLKVLGHEVTTAHSGHEAIEVARKVNPEFVLLDIGLPGMSGYEVASQLRKEECCNEAVIIAISGYGQVEDRRRSKESGFDYHLTKPLDTDALLLLISAAVR